MRLQFCHLCKSQKCLRNPKLAKLPKKLVSKLKKCVFLTKHPPHVNREEAADAEVNPVFKESLSIHLWLLQPCPGVRRILNFRHKWTYNLTSILKLDLIIKSRWKRKRKMIHVMGIGLVETNVHFRFNGPAIWQFFPSSNY